MNTTYTCPGCGAPIGLLPSIYICHKSQAVQPPHIPAPRRHPRPRPEQYLIELRDRIEARERQEEARRRYRTRKKNASDDDTMTMNSAD